jgi:hypothetical protein
MSDVLKVVKVKREGLVKSRFYGMGRPLENRIQ